MSRKFKVIGHLQPADFPRHFTMWGGLKFKVPGHRSLRAARAEAQALAESGWCATIVRRVPGGWIEVAGFDPVPLEG